MPHSPFAPRDGVFMPNDLAAMSLAFQLSRLKAEGAEPVEEREVLGRLIVRLYRMGMTEPARLAAAADFMVSSRLFHLATA